MKIEPHYVRFVTLLPRLGVKRITFNARGNALQLQETGLVVQGYLRTLRMPLLDLFFHSVLSQWTTLTIPYARITSLRYSRLIVARLLLTALVWLPLLAVGALLLLGPRLRLDEGFFIIGGGLAALGLVLTFYINFRLPSRNYLRFELPDGRQALIAFQIKRGDLQKKFMEQVEANRRLVRETTMPARS